jgi:D-serine deaminase-like pyridoxal phosphate-dependent protein
MLLTNVRTPFAFIDSNRLNANIAAMAERARAAGVKLRPHVKTHKSIEIAKMQIAAGAVGICCAKLGEAEVFADAGIADIRLPYPINPVNADRVLALQQKARLSIIVDDMEVAEAWSDAMVAAASKLDVLVKVPSLRHQPECGRRR